MGSSNHTAAHFTAELNQCDGQRRTLRRVGSGTQFVIEHQGPIIALLHHIHNGSHVAGEGGQALGNGLLVADVRQNGIKGGKLTAIPGRDVEAALRHQGQQSDGFQGDGFAAGVGAGDDHGVKVGA